MQWVFITNISILLLGWSCVTKPRWEELLVQDSAEIGKEALLHFTFFPWFVVEVRPFVFLEQSPRLLRELISLTWCPSSWPVCGQELLWHTLCTHCPVQLSSDLSSWKKDGVRIISCTRSHQAACSQTQDFRNASGHPGTRGTCSLLSVLHLGFVYRRSFSVLAYIHYWTKGLTGFVFFFFQSSSYSVSL